MERSEHEMEMLVQLTAGALGGFGEAVALGKITPEKAAHKAVVMAESAIAEMRGEGTLGAMGTQEAAVFEKPQR